jgi:hypothetical protein
MLVNHIVQTVIGAYLSIKCRILLSVTSASYSSIAAGERDATILRHPAAAATQSGDVLDGSRSTPSISGIALCIDIAAQLVHQCEAAIVQCSH